MFNPLSLQGPVDVSQGTLNVNSVPVKALSDLENKKRHPCFFKNRFLVKVNLL